MMIKFLKFLMILTLLTTGCSLSRFQAHETPVYEKPVRVAVLKDAKEFTLQIKGPYRVLVLDTNALLAQQGPLQEAKVLPTQNAIKIGEDSFFQKALRISPEGEAGLYVNNRSFRGDVHVIKDANNTLLVVNAVDLENYIKGVLYHEISDRWPLEAIKAQAVAVRTYALYGMQNSRSPYYDLTNDIYSQVYGGRTSEKYRTNLAVQRTTGLVLMYQGKILPAFYHATCAGHTEDVFRLWKHDLLPLEGVPCRFCENSPHFFWKKNMRLKDIQDKLNEKGYTLWLIKDISVMERNPSGRIEKLKITTRDEKSIEISGKDFRNIIGPNVIRSNNYTIEMKGYYVDFFGKGWGHGVGLCQWGANFMSREGYRFEDILFYYYPGSHLVNIYKENKDK